MFANLRIRFLFIGSWYWYFISWEDLGSTVSNVDGHRYSGILQYIFKSHHGHRINVHSWYRAHILRTTWIHISECRYTPYRHWTAHRTGKIHGLNACAIYKEVSLPRQPLWLHVLLKSNKKCIKTLVPLNYIKQKTHDICTWSTII